MSAPMAAPITVAQVGARGFGRVHLERIERLSLAGRVQLVGIADPAGPSDLACPSFASLDDLLAALPSPPDIVSIATPISTHLDLAMTAMSAGSHVFLEKPPVASLEEFWTLLRHQKETGRAIQIGFQSLGSAGVARLAGLVADGALGSDATVGARGVWVRDLAYFGRAAWAGRRTLDGRRIADGVVTNPLAHSLATAFAIAGIRDVDDIEAIETELYHAHAIEADDTSFVRVRRAAGAPVCAALTLCGPEQSPPEVVVQGSRGVARFSYSEDFLDLELDGHRTREVFERTCLLENLVDHLTSGAELLVSLASTVAFMCVLEATQDRPEPAAIPPSAVAWVGEGAEAHPVVEGVVTAIDEALRTGRGFAEQGLAWADAAARSTWRPRRVLATLAVEGCTVAEYADGSDMMPLSSPRPYLHPLRTRAGVRVSDAHPADHDWHCGLSLTMQDVNRVNFWGGRTFGRDGGYQWRRDQGVISHITFAEEAPGRLAETLVWRGPAIADADPDIDHIEVRETRALAWAGLGEHAWFLDAEFHLDAVAPASITLGGPGTNGRADAGYGGYQLRLRRNRALRIWGPDAEGSEALFGRTAPWVAWTGDFGDGIATIVMAHLDEASACDRWFVREGEWQGIGTAIAWDAPAALPLVRRHRLILADGVLDTAAVELLVRAARDGD